MCSSQMTCVESCRCGPESFQHRVVFMPRRAEADLRAVGGPAQHWCGVPIKALAECVLYVSVGALHSNEVSLPD